MFSENSIFYQAIFNAQLDVIIITNTTGAIVKVTPSFSDMFHFSASEIINSPIETILPLITFKEISTHISENGPLKKQGLIGVKNNDTRFSIDIQVNSFEVDKEVHFCFSIKDVSEEEAHRKKINQSFKSIVENSADYIMRYDKKGRHIYMNPAGLAISGFEEKGIIGKTHIEAGFDAAQSKFWEEKIQYVFNTGNTVEQQFEWEGTNGLMYLDWRLSPERDDEGNISSVVGISRDITRQKRIELALKENESRLNLLTKYTPTYLMELDTQGIFLYINRTYEGLSEDKVLGTNILNWLPPDVKGTVQKILENISVFKDTLTIEYDVPNIEGNIISYIAQFTPVFKDNIITKIILTATDFTNLKKTKKALKETGLKYKAFFEQTAIGVGEIESRTGRFIRINKRYAEIVGYTIAEMETISFQEISHPDDLQRDLNNMKLLLEGNIREFSMEKRYYQKNGNIVWVNLSVSPLWQIGETPTSHIAVVEDITERKEAEKNLLVYTHELERKNKELEQFAYIASHDLQEPLRTVISLTDLLDLDFSKSTEDELKKYLGYIKLSTSRMSALVTDLLEYSQIGKSKIQTRVDCNTIVAEIENDLSLTIQETESVILSNNLPTLLVYETEFRSLLQNLINNAIKFRKKNMPCRISISAKILNNEVLFQVEDNGIGIAKEHQERIFIIFQRLHTKKEYEGTGIGLAHCKKIIELHNGKIWIESTPNVGSTFNFTIPYSL
jgi:PAS domain S-box-containing protein